VAAADRVKHTGEHFRFNPMNSRERRVIHLSLRHETAVRSESCGAGPGRHVVVYPAGMPSLPEPPRSLEPPRRSMYDGPRPDRGPGGPPRGDRRDRGGRGDRGGRSDRGGPRGPRR
jgi:spoIIIJ-associated protein